MVGSPHSRIHLVKVIGIDEEQGRISLSYKLVSQSDGRDLDPTHAEAANETDRYGAALLFAHSPPHARTHSPPS